MRSRPSKISVSTVSKVQVGDRHQFTAAPPVMNNTGAAGACHQLAVHALDGAGNGVGTAAHQRVAGVGGEFHRVAGGHFQSRRAHLERAQHQAEAGQDQPAEKAALGIERVHRHRGADHHHQRRPRRPAASTRCARADQRHPAIGAEPGRVVVAVGHAGLMRRRHHPARLESHSSSCSSTRRRTASPATTQPSMLVGGGRPLPSPRPGVDGFQEHRALRQ